MKAGYEAMFTVYGQRDHDAHPAEFGRPLSDGGEQTQDVFSDAVNFAVATSSGAAPVTEVASSELQTQPADGETVKTALPLIKANIASLGPIDPERQRQMRVSGLGQVPASLRCQELRQWPIR